MTSHQIFFESSCQIDVAIGSSDRHLDLNTLSNCKQKQEARLILNELRERLRSSDKLTFELGHLAQQRLIELLSNQ